MDTQICVILLLKYSNFVIPELRVANRYGPILMRKALPKELQPLQVAIRCIFERLKNRHQMHQILAI